MAVLIAIGCIFLGLFIINYVNKVEPRSMTARGEVYLLGKYSFDVVNIILHPDKIIINNLETIPLKRVKYARAQQYSESVHSKTSVRITKYRLFVHYTDVHGFDSTIECRSKSSFGFGGYEGFANEVNRRVNYAPPSKPNEPYEI